MVMVTKQTHWTKLPLGNNNPPSVLSYVGQLASVRTPPVGLDGVRSVVYCQFSKKNWCQVLSHGSKRGDLEGFAGEGV